MKMSDMAPGGRLLCQSPDHPANATRDSMFFLEAKEGFYAFGCQTCTQIHRHPQLHVIAENKGAKRIVKHTRKAASIDRDNQGRITSFR